LIKAAELNSFKLDQGVYKVLISPGTTSEVVPVIIRETSFGATGPKVALVFVRALKVPDGFRHPAPMLKKIAEMNDRILIGRLSVNAKSGHIFYNSAFWLRSADKKTLIAELQIAFHMSKAIVRDLKPFVTEQ